MTTITARQLTKDFRGGIRAVDDLSFDVAPGVVTGFLGPNGAGKTTTLRMLLGLVTPTSGSVLIDGQSYRSLEDPTRQVGAVLEASGVHPARSARNHLRIIATVAGIAYSRVDECLDLVGLGDAKDRAVGGFSMGMRQRLELARALLGDPDVLVLDEPSNGLDPQGIAWLRSFLKWYASEPPVSPGGGGSGGPGLAPGRSDGDRDEPEGRIVLVSSHLLSEAQQTVDDVIIMSGGRLAAQGKLDELLAATKKTVRVRTPDADRLVDALQAADLEAHARDGLVVCEGAAPEVVGQAILDQRILVLEMTSASESLEGLFFTLTEGDANQGHGAGAMGDYTHLGGAGHAPMPNTDGRYGAPPGAPGASGVTGTPTALAGPEADGSPSHSEGES